MIVSVRKLRFVWRNNYLLSIRFFLHRIVVLHWRLHLSPHWRKFCTFSCTIEIFILDQVETCPESRIRLYHSHLKEIISVNKKKFLVNHVPFYPPPPFFFYYKFLYFTIMWRKQSCLHTYTRLSDKAASCISILYSFNQ